MFLLLQCVSSVVLRSVKEMGKPHTQSLEALYGNKSLPRPHIRMVNKIWGGTLRTMEMTKGLGDLQLPKI